MEITIEKYIIKPYRHCYRLAKRKGKKQWRTVGYYDGLKEAFMALFDDAIKNDELSLHIESMTKEDLEVGLDSLARRIEIVGQCIVKEIGKNIEGGKK